VADQGFSQQRLSLPNDSGHGSGLTDIQLQPALTEAIQSTLSRDFDEATVIDDPTKSTADLLVYPNVQFSWWQTSHLSSLPTISNSTELTIKDRQTGEVVEYFRHESVSDDPGRRNKDLALSVAEALTMGVGSLPGEMMKGRGDAESSKTTVQRILAANLDAISAEILQSRALATRASHRGQAVAQQQVVSPGESSISGAAPVAAAAAPNSITQPSNPRVESIESVGSTAAATFPVVEKNARRLALIIGNSKYEHVAQLPNTANDAQLVAGTLQRLGFKLVDNGPLIDLKKEAFERVLQEFGDEVQHTAHNRSTVALFYYAGHGMQINGVNYLVPVSANPTKLSDVPLQMVSADAAMSQMEDGGASLKIMILDACRNNPFLGISRSLGGGLAGMDAPDGTLIAYATKPDAVAADGVGRDSPYTEALVQAIQEPGLGLFDVFNETALIVKRKTDNTQQPWQAESAIEGKFCFAGCAE